MHAHSTEYTLSILYLVYLLPTYCVYNFWMLSCNLLYSVYSLYSVLLSIPYFVNSEYTKP